MFQRTFRRLGVGLAGTAVIAATAFAQSRKSEPAKTTVNPAAIRALDKEAEQLQKGFTDSLVKLADSYEAAGDLDKARAALRQILGVDPDREEIKERLDEMRNRVFKNNETEMEVDVTRGWVTTGVKVRAGEPVRFEASGSYKLIVNTNLTPDGVDTEDLNRDMAAGVKLGELMGVVYPPPKPRQKPKPGKPFAIGSQMEFEPEDSGMLFLRLNVPGGTKSIGSVKVRISGNIER